MTKYYSIIKIKNQDEHDRWMSLPGANGNLPLWWRDGDYGHADLIENWQDGFGQTDDEHALFKGRQEACDRL